MTDTVSISEARGDLGSLVRKTISHERTVLTDRGTPVAVLMNVHDLENLEDTIALLRNRLARAEGAQPIPHEEAKRRLRQAAAEAAAR